MILEQARKELEAPVTTPRYKLPFSKDETAALLLAAYAQEVATRGMAMAEDDTATMSNISKVSRWLTSEDTKPMLLLYGGVGNGKTTMARAVARLSKTLMSSMAAVADGMRDRKASEQLWLKSRAIRVPSIHTAQELASLASSDQQAFERTGMAGFLIIDDLGCEPAVVKNWGTEVTPITDIIYKRYDGMMPTMVTTNLTKADIRKVYGSRVADRFNETFETIGYNGESYRR